MTWAQLHLLSQVGLRLAQEASSRAGRARGRHRGHQGQRGRPEPGSGADLLALAAMTRPR